jgi:Flp pilus assembly pilin Flp
MELMRRLYREENGQTATEYMVLLASVVAALLGAAYLFKDKFSSGVTSMGSNVQSNLSKGFK